MNYKILLIATLILCNTITIAHSTAINKNPIDSLEQKQATVKIAEKVVILSGNQQFTGKLAPNFTLVDESFKKVQLSDYKGKTILLSVVPSIDTGICSLQTKRFNDEVLKQPSHVTILTISTDLPFAQKRYCIDEKVDQIQLLSDAVWRDFGTKYGLLIKDMGLLARAVLIIDSQGILRYQQIVPQLSDQPDYDTALAALQEIIEQETIEQE